MNIETVIAFISFAALVVIWAFAPSPAMEETSAEVAAPAVKQATA